MSSLRTSSGVAVLAAVALLVPACSTGAPDADGHGGDDDVTTEVPTETDQPTPEPTPSPATGLRQLGAPVDLGPGTIVGATPDGQHLWVLAPDDEGSDLLGCEGIPFDVLWIVDPLDGDRRRAIDVPVEDHPFVTDVLVRGAPDGQVAIEGSCEGFLGTVQVGTVTSDGRIEDLRDVPMPPIELMPWTMAWVPGTTDFVATGWEDFENPGVYVIDSVTGDWIDIDDRPLSNWIPIVDGVVVELESDEFSGTMRARFVGSDGSILSEFPADAIVPAQDGFPVLAFSYDYASDPSTGTVSLVGRNGVRELLVDDAQGFDGSLTRDGSVAAWAQSDPPDFDTVLVLHEIDTGRQVRLDDGWFGGITFVEGGLTYVIEGPNPDAEFGDPQIRFRPWAA